MQLLPEFVSEAPAYHLLVEGFLLVCIMWLTFRKSYSPKEKNELSEKVRV
jgi:hypothetical protein